MVSLPLVARGVSLAAGVALLWLAHRTSRRWSQTAASSFAVLLGTLGVTALCVAATAHTGTPYKLLWLYTGLSIPLALIFFSFDYYGLGFFVSRSRVFGLLTPAVLGGVGGTLLVLGTPMMSPGSRVPLGLLGSLPALVFRLAAPLNRIGLLYATAVMLLAVGLVLRTVYRYEHLDARLGLAISFVGFWPWVANLVIPQMTEFYSFGVGLSALAVGYAGSALLAWLAVGPLGLFAASPAAGNVGPETVLDSIESAVLMLDDRGNVLRLNAVASRWFGARETEAVGGPVEAVLDADPDSLTDGERVVLNTVDGARTFEVTRSPVRDRTGLTVGHVVVLRDVTERLTREQRLEVLNRVLRHNLRNSAAVIRGRAQLIREGAEGPESAEPILDRAEGLIRAAEQARDIDAMMTAAAGADRTDVAPAVEAVVADVRDRYPGVEVRTDVPAGAAAAVDRTVLETVLSNLAENACEHNDADDPVVVVSADRRGDGSLAISVADNGPGIPEAERAVLEAGGEDPLRHGTGLGLWAAQWGTSRMGGSLSFAENEPRGSVVTVSVPAADDRVERVEAD